MKKKILVGLATGVFLVNIVGVASANLLNNGSFELGSTDPITGHNVQSAADNWRQWRNDGTFLTSELITDNEMLATFGTGVIDGDKAFRITTNGATSGGYTIEDYHTPGWDVYAELTFSAWVYTITGTGGLWNGSNADGFTKTVSTTTGQWEFLSVTIPGGNYNNEPLLYSVGAGADFIVDAAWLNSGSSVDNPTAPVPEPATMLLFGTGLAVLAGASYRRKNKA